MLKDLSLIVATDRQGAIGRNGQLLCHLPADMRHFKKLTMGHTVIMGRKTFESLPGGALPGRQNIVITRNASYQAEGATVVTSLVQALLQVTMPGEVFVIGGAEIYRLAMPVAGIIHLTVIEHTFPDADTFFPEIDPAQWNRGMGDGFTADDKNPYNYTFWTLRRKNTK